MKKISIRIILCLLLTIFSLNLGLSKSNAAPETRSCFIDLKYQVHVQNIGWMKPVSVGNIAGTTGRALPIEAIKIFNEGTCGLELYYRVHVQNLGWLPWTSHGYVAGTTGRALPIEAIEIKLYPYAAEYYSIRYQVHEENNGWLPVKYNGQTAGTVGQALHLEAISISYSRRY